MHVLDIQCEVRDAADPVAGRPSFACLPTTSIGRDTRVRLKAPLPAGAQGLDGRLALYVASDCRFDATMVASCPETDWSHREDIAFCSIGQRFHIPLPARVLGSLHENNLQLTVEGEAPISFVAPEAPYQGVAMHLQVGGEADPYAAALERLKHNCLAPFGWVGSCVTEGLYDLHQATGDASYDAALRDWLSYFLNDVDPGGDDPETRFRHAHDYGIESTLPYAAIARLFPGHPWLNITWDFWQSRRLENGLIVDPSRTCSAEGSYTIAYPMMVIGTQRGNQAMIEEAAKQLRHTWSSPTGCTSATATAT